MALTADHHRLCIPNLQLIHGRVQVKWRCWSYLLCGLLLLGPRSAVLLPASIRDNPTGVTQPGPHKNGRVVTHHVAHCCVLIQGCSNYATPCAGAGVGNGRSNCAGWFLCFLHPPGESCPAGPPKTITRVPTRQARPTMPVCLQCDRLASGGAWTELERGRVFIKYISKHINIMPSLALPVANECQAPACVGRALPEFLPCGKNGGGKLNTTCNCECLDFLLLLLYHY